MDMAEFVTWLEESAKEAAQQEEENTWPEERNMGAGMERAFNQVLSYLHKAGVNPR